MNYETYMEFRREGCGVICEPLEQYRFERIARTMFLGDERESLDDIPASPATHRAIEVYAQMEESMMESSRRSATWAGLVSEMVVRMDPDEVAQRMYSLYQTKPGK
ncbi:MAG: hypothetical protein IKH04_13050 [Kiritimatiellae bacterium]|nr:hypothetical protein [Kiritimatiellia bacterium]